MNVAVNHSAKILVTTKPLVVHGITKATATVTYITELTRQLLQNHNVLNI